MMRLLRTGAAVAALMGSVWACPAFADVADDLRAFAEAQATGSTTDAASAARALIGADFSSLGFDAADVRQLRIEVADALAEGGDLAAAAAIYRDVIAEAETAIDADAALDEAEKAGAKAELSDWLRRLAALELALDRPDEAAALLETAQERLEAQLGAEHPKLAFIIQERLDAMARADAKAPAPQDDAIENGGRRAKREALTVRLEDMERRRELAETRGLVMMGGEIGAKSLDDRAAAKSPFQEVRVFFGTNRARSGRAEPDEFYGSDAADLELGVVSISVPTKRRLGEIAKKPIWDRSDKPDKARYFVIEAVTPVVGPDAEARFGAALAAQVGAADEREVLVFIHGYNQSFQDAAFRAAQLAVDVDLRGAPVMYTWPSKGKLTGYVSDVTDNARLIERDLSRFLRLVVERSGAKRINVVAHSAGNLHLMNALEELEDDGLRGADGEAPFDQVVWASPDVLETDFRIGFETVKGLAKGMTLYASGRDKALISSSLIRGADALRAGDARPPLPLALPDLVTVDTTQVADRGLGHDDYAGPALDDFKAVVWFSLSPDKRCPLVRSTNALNNTYYALFEDRGGGCHAEPFAAAIDLARQRGWAGAVAYAEQNLDQAQNSTAANAETIRDNWRATLDVLNQIAP